MKLIHTSDWHLGHLLYGYDRREEQTDMLRQVAEALEAERPDALLVSGDIFHTAQPSGTVQRMLVEWIMEMRRRVPAMVMVLTAGNHDSASRLEIHRPLWEELGVSVIGGVDRECPDRHIVEVPGKGWIAAVPYCSGRNLPEDFFAGLMERVAALDGGCGLPVVLMAHTAVAGADFTGHDDARGYTVGGIDSVDLGELGAGYDYVALGHIHRPQFVAGSSGHVRYSGTPLPVSFDEAYQHSLSVVEMEKHGSVPLVREIPVVPLRPLVTLPVAGTAAWDEALALLADFPDDAEAYIRLNVRVDKALTPQAHQEALRVCAEKSCRFCLINAVRESGQVADRERHAMTVSEFRAVSPLELAERYAAAIGEEFGDDMREMFNSVAADLQDGGE